MKVNGTRTFFVAMNMAKKPFDDPRVRKACNHAIDRKLIIDRVLSGTAVPFNGVLSPRRLRLQPRSAGVQVRPGAGEEAARRGRLRQRHRR